MIEFTTEQVEYIHEVMDMANDHGIVLYGDDRAADQFLDLLLFKIKECNDA